MDTQKRALITHTNDYSRLFNMQKMTWHSNLIHPNIPIVRFRQRLCLTQVKKDAIQTVIVHMATHLKALISAIRWELILIINKKSEVVIKLKI